MPLKEINYDKTHFYKIVCKDTNIKDCYVGHTTDFTSRKYDHKSKCNNENHKCFTMPVYQFIRENGGWENWDMILIDTLECENNLKARAKEREFIEKLNATLNIHKKLYVSYEETIERQKEWEKQNPERYAEIHKKSRDKLKEEHPERYKQYRKTNLERNGHKYREREKEKVECECGAIINRGYIAGHKKTKKHQQYLQNQNNPQE